VATTRTSVLPPAAVENRTSVRTSSTELCQATSAPGSQSVIRATSSGSPDSYTSRIRPPTPGSQTFATALTRTGNLWADAVEQLSGGTRPCFQSAIDYWNSFGFAPLTKVPF
jgi:hypothetical protein